MSTVLKINGVDVTDYLDNGRGALSIERGLQQRDILRGRFKDRAGTFRPALRQPLILEVDGVRKFGGSIATTQETDFGDYIGIVTSFDAAPFAAYADTAVINGITLGPYLRDHVDEVLERLADYGITRDPAMALGANLGPQGWPFKYVSEVLDALAALGDCVWEIDPYGVLYMRAPATTAASAPFTATNETIAALVGGHDLGLYVNVVWLQYGGTGTREYSDTFHGDGTTQEFVFTNHLSLPPPTVLHNGVTKPVGAYGVDDLEWTFKPRDPTINYRGGLMHRASDGVLVVTDTVVATYTAEFPGDVSAFDAAGIAAYGEIAIVEQLPGTFDRANAQQAADARLRERGGQPRTFTLTTYRDGDKPGDVVPVNVPERALDADCLILTARRIFDGPKADGSDYWRTELEIVEGRRTVETWIQYFKKQSGAYTGSLSSSSSAGGALPPSAAGGGAGAGSLYLGGDRLLAYSGGTAWVPVPGFVDVLLEPGTDVTIRAQSWVRSSAHTINVRIVALESGGVEVGRGTATNATSATAAGAFQEFTIVRRTSAQYYRAEMQLSSVAAEGFVAAVTAYASAPAAVARRAA